MGITTQIEWTDSTINPQMGCAGCELANKKRRTCYAAILTDRYGGGKGWPETFEKPVIFPDRIQKALGWSDLAGKDRPEKPWLNKLPRHIFLDDMGDTWTEGLPVDWLLPYIPSMEASPHIFQFLTKRAHRMLTFFETLGYVPSNFHLGVSITDKATANGRMPTIRIIKERFPTAKTFISAEPLVGPVDLSPWLPYLDQVIVGGESGPDARPMLPSSEKAIRTQCLDAGVPYFLKQWGEFKNGVRVGKKKAGRMADGKTWDGMILSPMTTTLPGF